MRKCPICGERLPLVGGKSDADFLAGGMSHVETIDRVSNLLTRNSGQIREPSESTDILRVLERLREEKLRLLDEYHPQAHGTQLMQDQADFLERYQRWSDEFKTVMDAVSEIL